MIADLRQGAGSLGWQLGEALGRLREGVPRHEAGSHSAGNGALMRVAPLLVPYLRRPGPDVWADTVLAAVVTHRSSPARRAFRCAARRQPCRPC